jgi:hypothetical protein
MTGLIFVRDISLQVPVCIFIFILISKKLEMMWKEKTMV